MNIKLILAVGVCVFSVGALAAPADTTHFRQLRYNGSGCRQGSASAALYRLQDAAPPTEFAIYFSDFMAMHGPGVSAGERKSECRVSLHFDLPRNRQFTVLGANLEGYADLSEGTSATQRAEYGFPSGDVRQRFQTILKGEFHDNYSRSDNTGGVLWSPCGKGIPFFMVLNVEVSGDRSVPALITTDQVTGLMEYRFKLAWRDCGI